VCAPVAALSDGSEWVEILDNRIRVAAFLMMIFFDVAHLAIDFSARPQRLK
jgi:hypothetical protein